MAKNETEQLKLLYDRASTALSSKEFKHELFHHTDLDIHKVERIGHATWITLKDGSYFRIALSISRSPYKVPVQ